MDWSLFKRAVADNEEPTPGYMYRDMAQWTFNDYNTQMKFIEALLKKLKPSSSVHVLFKVLRIIKVMCETGHNDFQKEMQKNARTEEIKLFVTYRGVPDPRHGEALNEKVRQAAREALEVIFAHRKEGTLRIEAGYGSNTTFTNGNDTLKPTFTTGHSVTGSLSEGPMMSFSSNIAPMPARNKWAEHVAQQASTAHASTASRVLTLIADKAKHLYPGSGSLGYKSSKEVLHESALQLGTEGGILSATYSGAFVPPSHSLPSSSSLLPAGFQSTEMATTTTPYFGEKNGTSGGSGWKFIDSIGTSAHVTPPASNSQPQQLTLFQALAQRVSQMKNTPQRVELHTFLAQCRETAAISRDHMRNNYNSNSEGDTEIWDELSEALDAHLGQSHPWQQRLNVLVAIEALLSTHEDGDAIMRNSVTQYFRENPEDIQRNVSVVQSTLRERAQRVLRLLGVPERSGKSMDTSGEASPTTQQARSAGNGMDSCSWLTSLQQQQLQQQQQQQGDVDLGGMTVRATRRVTRDPNKLKKRAPMRSAEEEQQREENEGGVGIGMGMGMGLAAHNNSGMGPAFSFTVGNGNGNVNTTHSNGKNNNRNVFDDLFTSPSVPPETHSQKMSSFIPAMDPAHISSTSNATGNKESAANDSIASSFDFLSIGNNNNNNNSRVTYAPPVAPVAPFLQEQQQQQQEHNLANASRPWGGADIFSLSSPTPSPAGGLSPLDLMQMQQQLQVLMGHLQQNPNPAVLAQVQQLMLQQQQFMALMAQQQQQQQQQQQTSLKWGTGASNDVPSHQHFTTGAAPHAGCAKGANTFAEVQQEMMNRMGGEQKHDE